MSAISLLSLDQNICGSGSAFILHSNVSRLPSDSDLIIGFWIKFGAMPSWRLLIFLFIIE